MPQQYRKRKERRHMKPMPMQDIMASVLGRHKIANQVTSAMVVQDMNNYLFERLDAYIRTDVRALSFAGHELKIACKNPSASFVMQDYTQELFDRVKRQFPSIAIEKVTFVLNQDPWLHRGYDQL